MTTYVVKTVLVRALIIWAVVMMILCAIMLPKTTEAQSSGSGKRDCDANAVLKCGAYTTAELNKKYESQDGAKSIYAHFGISSAEVASMHTTAVSGFVTQGGRVLIGDKEVATDAITAGRQNMAGSTAVERNGTTFYTRPPSASFQETKLDAYVVMKDGVFSYAVIKSCGNPVKATAKKKEVAKPVEKVKEQPKVVQKQAPAPAPVQAQQQAQAQQTVVYVAPVQKQETTVVNMNVVETAPPAQPAPAPAPAPQPAPAPPAKPAATPPAAKELPKTGVSSGEAVGLSAALGLGSAIGYAAFAAFRSRFQV